MENWTMMGLAILMGCNHPPPEQTSLPTDTQTSAGDSGTQGNYVCGDVSQFNMVFRGDVEDAYGDLVPGADVYLEERNWAPGVFGQDRTDAGGRFEVSGFGMPLVEDCWGVGVQFWMVGETETLWGDKPLNSPIIDALASGGSSIDLDFPLILRQR